MQTIRFCLWINYITTHFFLQIVFKLFQKMSHGRVTLKVIEVIVYPQQDYPCNLQELKRATWVLVGHILDKNKWQVCKIRNMYGMWMIFTIINIIHLSMDGSDPSYIFSGRQPISNQSLKQPVWELTAGAHIPAPKLTNHLLKSRGNLEPPSKLLCLSLDCGRRMKSLHKSHAGMGTTCRGPEVESNRGPSCYKVNATFAWARYYGIAVPTYLVPETRVMEPLQELLAHDHGAGEEGPVCQQEVLNIGGIHHRVFLHQMHGETLCRALFNTGV